MSDIRKQAEEAYMTGHYPYLLQALAVAITRCGVWRMADTDNVFTLIELFDFAKAWDEEHPLQPGHFYLVSTEGAIGLSPGAEWMTHWLFIPMEPGPERDELLAHIDARLAEMAAEEVAAQAQAQASDQAQAQASAQAQAQASAPPAG